MKVTTFTVVAALAIASVNGAAMPQPNAEASAEATNWCRMRGQACGKLKRAADAASTILAEIEEPADLVARDPHTRWCWMRGQACGKAKRAATAIEDAIKDANNFTELADDHFEKRDPHTWWCHMRGQACGKVKREAAAEPEPVPIPEATNWCRMRGQACGKVKRAVDEINAIIAEESEELVARDPKTLWCHMRGQACGKAKRALDNLQVTANEALAYLGTEED